VDEAIETARIPLYFPKGTVRRLCMVWSCESPDDEAWPLEPRGRPRCVSLLY